MAEEENDSNGDHPPTARRRLVAAACLVVATVAAISLLLWMRQRPSFQEQLKAIDAAHAVPDRENAGPLYTELAWDSNSPSLDSSFLPPAVLSVTISRPWRSAEFPQMADWIKERQAIIDGLRKASDKSRCWFPVSDGAWCNGKRSQVGYRWAHLLLEAANNDLGEGRTDAGLEKLVCLFRMAGHFVAQGNSGDYILGRGMASRGLERLGRLVILEGVSPDWLAKLETVLPSGEDRWAGQSKEMEEVTRLYKRKFRQGILPRLIGIVASGRSVQDAGMFHLLYLAECRAGRTLLALHRYRNQTGAWPTSLAEVESQVSADTVTDPFSGKPFGYRHSGEGFLLYSVGPNGTDEGGKPKDDRIFWPRWVRSHWRWMSPEYGWHRQGLCP
jgi:hypothetical protein